METHKHLFKQLGGGCMVVGNEKWPCDVTYGCKCGEKFELMTTTNGYSLLPETFETQPRSEMHSETLNAITEAVITPGGLTVSSKKSAPKEKETPPSESTLN